LGSALTSTGTRTPVKTQGVETTAIMKTGEERREGLKRLAAMPNGIDKLCSILTGYEACERTACGRAFPHRTTLPTAGRS
jgi:hypothetical protein